MQTYFHMVFTLNFCCFIKMESLVVGIILYCFYHCQIIAVDFVVSVTDLLLVPGVDEIRSFYELKTYLLFS